MLIISGTNSQELSKAVAKACGFNMLAPLVTRYENNEMFVTLPQDVAGQSTIIIANTSWDANNGLLEILLIANELRNNGAASIGLFCPYIAYSRQDKGQTSGIGLIFQMLTSAGISEFFTLDIHSTAAFASFSGTLHNIDLTPVFAPHLKEYNNHLIVAPDSGAQERAKKLANMLAVDYTVISKTREGASYAMELTDAAVQNRHCIVVDDIVYTGGTLLGATELLLSKGAKAVSACITHAILPTNYLDNIINSPIKHIYTAQFQSPAKIPSNKFTICDITLAISEAITAKNRKNCL